ncbi:MAG: hypothetical protein O3A13_02700 [Proteobacteria bacterium]|nr:hypothetical protein [Pseudomonadota bacterium]MDA0992525.1 hypothetical protein [Pseudomonadota bacterium]
MKLAVYKARENYLLTAGCILFMLFAMTGLSRAQDPATPSDVATIDGLINAYYESVSGHPGKRDGERMLSLFIGGGKISIGLESDEPTHELAEDYLRTERFLTLSSDFFEREISRDVQRFGNMANVISTYGISDAMENTKYTARGVTVFQLVRHSDRWWILSTMWQRESPEFPLPAELLD